MIKHLFISICFLLLNYLSFSQEVSDSTIQKNRKSSIFIEVGGATGYFSLNFNRKLYTIKKIDFKGGFGIGYQNNQFFYNQDFGEFVDNLKESIISYTFRFEVIYGKKMINPVFGYSYTHAFPFEDIDAYFLVNTFNIGVEINISKRFYFSPRYHLMIFKEPNYNESYIIHWSGVQIGLKL
ncbi:MAG: hypothetical protein A3K10_01105 [Bacteroidetes bacterium RIFCSPLOWO2_12_FULL_31_6]|nr:MAG: hypothetical protein A3K10_01105 [Bacteroidetes bacterium RIFCSPLOWO2_12_FULL_31_6]